jgi:hypothetical protein
MKSIVERPILFSAEMVRAILDGRKTQTRRVMKPQPSTVDDAGRWYRMKSGGESLMTSAYPCPYGAPGDTLWVRETFCAHWGTPPHDAPQSYRIVTGDELPRIEQENGDLYQPASSDIMTIWYEAEGNKPFHLSWDAPDDMPRWASRITLRITNIRVERLQDISEDDARAEGATMRPACNGFQHRYPGWSMDWSKVGQLSHYATGAKRGVKAPLTEGDVSLHSPKWAFASLWNEINGSGAWEANPWVWVISFEKVKP